jgi:SHS2 domain-containing protein
VGTQLSDAEREVGTHVKAITWHQLAVGRDANGWRAVVYVDL